MLLTNVTVLSICGNNNMSDDIKYNLVDNVWICIALGIQLYDITEHFVTNWAILKWGTYLINIL